MANGVQLATAYISLNVETRNIKKQVEGAFNGTSGMGRRVGTSIGSNITSGIREHLNGGTVGALFSPIAIAGVRWAGAAGRAIGVALRTAIVSSVSLGVGAALLGLGSVLTSGLKRLSTLQQSRIQLSLTLSPQEISKLQTQIAEVVKGTNVTLDEAMAAVPKAINAGLSADQVRQYIKDLADAAAATGGQANTGWLDEIFSKIRADGKLATDQIDSLNSAGLDIRGTLKKAFGWDDKTLDKNLKNKKVGIDQVQKAIQKVYGSIDAGNGKTGLAQLLGTKTLDGSIKAAKASLSRIGADFISAIVGKNPSEDPLESYAMGINKITEGLKGIESWVTDNREEIHDVFTRAGNAAKRTGDIVEKVINAFSRVKEFGSSAATWISGKWNTLTTTLGTIKTKVEDIFDSVKKKFESVFGENGWFAQQFKKLGELVDKVRDILGLGPATANAAPDSAPFNPGPRAPGAAAPQGTLVPGLDLTPGMVGGSNAGGMIGVMPGGDVPIVTGPNAKPSGYVNDSGLIARIPKGRYVGADEFAKGDPKVLGDLSQGLGDCTSAIQDLVNIIEGKPTAGRSLSNGQSFFTGTIDQWAAENGFIATDKPMPGTFQVGASDTHAQATLPGGTPFNWGSPESAAVKGIDGSLGAWDPSFTKHYYKPYASGGHVWGAGSATSDSIPAMLSNGEHVLTASDVKAMGGQKGVYAFRSMLGKGLIPGFAPGGGIDPNQVQDLNNQLQDAAKASEIAQAQFNETMNNADATEIDKLQAQQNLNKTLRDYGQLQSDAPIIASGGTPPDRSIQNSILDNTDSLALAEQRLADAQAKGDVPYSQMLQLQASRDQALRGREQAIAALNAQNAPTNFIDEFQRQGGFVPVAASNTGVAGTSALSSVFDMGNQVVSTLIDTGAQMASAAASAAAMGAGGGGGGGGGAGAAMAAQLGIQIGASIAKRGVKFGFDALGIGADALIAQLFPFGAPRAIGYDYTNFIPAGVMPAATTTLEKMGAEAMKRTFGQPGQNNFEVPAQPEAPAPPGAAADSTIATPDAPAAPVPLNTDQGIVGPNDPRFVTPPYNGFFPVNPNGAGGAGGGGSWAKGGAINIYDQGGILQPGTLALNASRRPEKVLTDKQWASLANLKPASSKNDAPLVKIDAIYGMSPDDVANKIESKQRLAMMRYAGRP